MTAHKDFKRIVRARMQKTGESYTSARARVLAHPPRTTHRARSASQSPAAAPAGYASTAGMSDEAVKKASGCTWERWVKTLDYVEAHNWSHGAIATFIYEKYKVDGWWSQMIAVGYERIKGLRQKGQRREGDFEANRSVTVPVGVSTLFKAVTVAKRRAAWLPEKVTMRKATPSKTVRMLWSDGTPFELWFVSKARDKSSVQVQHRKLPDKTAQTRMKALWGERLDALKSSLT